MASRGSAYRAEGNQTLRTVCANCGKSIPTEVGHAHPLDVDVRRETWGLVGYHAALKTSSRRVPLATLPDGGPPSSWMN